MGAAWAGLRLAVGTLTMIPVGDLAPTTRRVAAWSMTLAPLAALPLGLLVGAISWLGQRGGLPTFVSATLVIAALAIGTRAMHLDGLADTADGVGAGWDCERALRVLRTGDVGPMGVAALVVVVLLQVSALAALVPRANGWLLVGTAVAASRSAATLGCVRGLRPSEGSRLGAAVGNTVPPIAAGLVVVVVGAALTAAGMSAGLPWWQGVVAIAALLLVVAWLVRMALRVFGGVNGDVLGASIELGLAALLVTLTIGAGS